jgi:hypothetical protein
MAVAAAFARSVHGAALPPTFSMTKSALAIRHRHIGRVTEASAALPNYAGFNATFDTSSDVVASSRPVVVDAGEPSIHRSDTNGRRCGGGSDPQPDLAQRLSEIDRASEPWPATDEPGRLSERHRLSYENRAIFGQFGTILISHAEQPISVSISRGSTDAKACCRRRIGVGSIRRWMYQSRVENAHDNPRDDDK